MQHRSPPRAGFASRGSATGAAELEKNMKFTLMGYTVSNAEQARSILMVAVLKGDKVIATQARAVIAKFEAA